VEKKGHNEMTVDKTSVKLAGVIGDPILHSMSPIIQNYWIKKSNLNGYYIPIKVLDDEVEKKIRYLRELGFLGLNVTIPHKVKAFNLADKLTEEAKKVGAVNTLFFQSNQIIGDNTDTYGFKNSVYQNFPFYNFKNQKVLIYGAGGASRAILSVYLSEKADEIRLINRDRKKANDLGNEFSDRIKIYDWSDHGAAIMGATTLINCTSLGTLNKESFPHNLKGAHPKAVGIDLVYNPMETTFMRKAAKEDIKCINGLDMLVHQAIPGFIEWFKKEPAYTKHLRQLLIKSVRGI